MTAQDACQSSGTPFEYGRQRIRLLVKQGWIRKRNNGNKFYYKTIENPATQHFYEVANTATSKAPTFKIPDFYGQHPTVAEAISQEISRTRNLPGSMSLPEFLAHVIGYIKVRSHRTSEGLFNQVPEEEEVREWLERYIKQTQRNLRLAEVIYETHKLWSKSPTVWSWISEGPPNENATRLNDVMLKIATGSYKK